MEKILAFAEEDFYTVESLSIIETDEEWEEYKIGEGIREKFLKAIEAFNKKEEVKSDGIA